MLGKPHQHHEPKKTKSISKSKLARNSMKDRNKKNKNLRIGDRNELVGAPNNKTTKTPSYNAYKGKELNPFR